MKQQKQTNKQTLNNKQKKNSKKLERGKSLDRKLVKVRKCQWRMKRGENPLAKWAWEEDVI